MLKALVLKELRETAWIALAALLADLALAAACAGYPGLPFTSTAYDIPFLDGGFLEFFCLISAALAAALGLRQTVFESRRGDLFLRDRPANMRQVLAVKLAVGAALYLVCGLVAILSYAAWATRPGNHASPFLWWMTADAWKAWGVIVVIYLSAFLAGIRPARWFGTRLLPLPAGVVLAIVLVFPLHWPLLGIAAILFAAACLVGLIHFAAQTGDLRTGAAASKPREILRPLGLALVLAVGFAAVFAIGVAMAFFAARCIVICAERRQTPVYGSLAVRADGTPLVVRYLQGRMTCHALDGRELPEPRAEEGWLPSVSLLPTPRPEPLMFPLEGDARIGRFLDGPMSPDMASPNIWFFLHDGARDGRGYFVGYNSQSKRRVGFIGRDGLRPERPPAAQWFPMDGVLLASGGAFSRYAGRAFNDPCDGEPPRANVYMISGRQLLDVDLRKGSVATLMESAGLIGVKTLAAAPKRKAAGKETPRARLPERLAVRTTDRALILDAAGKQLSAYLIPEELRRRRVEFYEVEPGAALLIAARPGLDRGLHEEILWIDASGKVLRRAEASLGEGDGHSGEGATWELAMACPAPVVLASWAAAAAPFSDLASGQESDYAAALTRSLAAWWPALLAVSLLAAALAWRCRRRHHRLYQPYGGAWFALILLTGIPGLVGYRFHRRWPVLEKCPACGHDVPRDREACAECGAAFPPPEPKGCEVFA